MGRGFFRRRWVSKRRVGRGFLLVETGRLMLDKLIREAHNRGRIWGEGQPLRSRSTRVSSAVAHPSSQLRTVRDAYFTDRRWHMFDLFWNACLDDEGQDIAEYAVMLAVILVLVVGTIRLVGSNANNVFSSVASSVH